MKTLVKSQVKPTIAISYKQSYKKKLQTFQFSFKSTKMLFNFGNIILFASLLFFLIVPESPELHSDLCNKYNSPQACNVW